MLALHWDVDGASSLVFSIKGFFMSTIKFGLMLFTVLASSNAFANSFTYTVSGGSEQQARLAADAMGRMLCYEAGYPRADVEIVSLWIGIPGGYDNPNGVPTHALAIATCF